MAVEKFIRGKRDDCHHDGKAANTRRLQAAIYDQAIGLEIYLEAQKPRPLKLIEMKPGIKYPLDTEGKKD